MKKILLSVLGLLSVAALAITGTIAYLQWEDSAVNVMTLGNVKIEQIEQERDANGNLVEFKQAKAAYPAVGPVAWAAQGVNVNGTEYKVFTPELKNVVDKIVTVNNIGKSDAYVRTILTIETPEFDPNNWVHINTNADNIDWSNWILVEIDGVKYCSIVATYKNALAPGESSAPSLLQVFLDSAADNEYCAAFGDAWEIHVLSQAVQTKGFDDAATALNTGFGEVTEVRIREWFGMSEIPVVADTAEEVSNALAAGKDVILGGDITDFDADTTITVAAGKDVTLNLNGHKIEAEADGTGNREIFLVKGSMTVVGGEIELVATRDQGWGAMATAFDVTAGGVLNLKDVTVDVSGTSMAFAVHLNNWGEVALNAENCTLKASYIPVRVFNSGPNVNNVTIQNSTLEGKFCFWVHNYTSVDFGGKVYSGASAAYDSAAVDARLNFNVLGNGNTFVNTGKAPILYGFTGTVYFDANGNEVA